MTNKQYFIDVWKKFLDICYIDGISIDDIGTYDNLLFSALFQPALCSKIFSTQNREFYINMRIEGNEIFADRPQSCSVLLKIIVHDNERIFTTTFTTKHKINRVFKLCKKWFNTKEKKCWGLLTGTLSELDTIIECFRCNY